MSTFYEQQTGKKPKPVRMYKADATLKQIMYWESLAWRGDYVDQLFYYSEQSGLYDREEVNDFYWEKYCYAMAMATPDDDEEEYDCEVSIDTSSIKDVSLKEFLDSLRDEDGKL